MDDDDKEIALKLFPSYPGDDLGVDNFKDEIDDTSNEVFRTSSFTHNSTISNFHWDNLENIDDFKARFNSTSSQKDDNFFTKENEHLEWPSLSEDKTPLKKSYKIDEIFERTSSKNNTKNWKLNSFDDDFVDTKVLKQNRTKKRKIISVEIVTKKSETSFGFSVLGGCDDGQAPVIDYITAGKFKVNVKG